MPAEFSRSETRSRFFLVSTVVALSLLGDALLYAVLPSRPEDFRVLVWQVGILLGANRLVRLITNELAGRIADRFGSKKPLVAAVIIGALTTASYALPWGFWWLLAARLVWGACWSVLRVEGYISALAVSTDRNRGKIFAVYEAITRTGSGGGVLVGGFLYDLAGLKPTFFLFSLITVSGTFLLLKASRDRMRVVKPGGEKQNPDQKLSPGKYSLFLWACALAITMAEQMIANLTGRLVVDRIFPGLENLAFPFGIASLTGLLLSFRALGEIVIGPMIGAFSDRLDRKRLLLLISLFQIVAVLLLAFLRHWLLIMVILVLQFFTAVSARLVIYTIAGDRAPKEKQALFMNRFATFVDLGTALGPIVAFTVYAGFGFGWVAALALLLIFFVISCTIGGYL